MRSLGARSVKGAGSGRDWGRGPGVSLPDKDSADLPCAVKAREYTSTEAIPSLHAPAGQDGATHQGTDVGKEGFGSPARCCPRAARRILVPLSGTPASELVLPLLAGAARSGRATVRVLHVEGVAGPLFSESGRVVVYADQEMARLKAHWLNHLAVRTAVHDVPAECAVRFGEPAQEILAEADAWGAELIVVTTAPWRGFQWIRRGGVADAVFRDAAISVIRYRAPSRRALRVGSTATL